MARSYNGAWLVAAVLATASMGCGRLADHEGTVVDVGVLADTDREKDSGTAMPDGRVDAGWDAVGDAADADARDALEYCPDPLYPPRTDGCPCFARGLCSEIGKICDYCPYGPATGTARMICTYDIEFEKDPVTHYKYAGVAGSCPDAGGGG